MSEEPKKKRGRPRKNSSIETNSIQSSSPTINTSDINSQFEYNTYHSQFIIPPIS